MARVTPKTNKQPSLAGHVDHARLAATTDADIERQMAEDGEDPSADHSDWHPSVQQVRLTLNLTQTEIAALLNMPLSTWRNWEQGRTAIDAPGRALLFVLQREPEAVLRAMKATRAA